MSCEGDSRRDKEKVIWIFNDFRVELSREMMVCRNLCCLYVQRYVREWKMRRKK